MCVVELASAVALWTLLQAMVLRLAVICGCRQELAMLCLAAAWSCLPETALREQVVLPALLLEQALLELAVCELGLARLVVLALAVALWS